VFAFVSDNPTGAREAKEAKSAKGSFLVSGFLFLVVEFIWTDSISKTEVFAIVSRNPTGAREAKEAKSAKGDRFLFLVSCFSLLSLFRRIVFQKPKCSLLFHATQQGQERQRRQRAQRVVMG
jgi:hypothetical protein